MSKITPEDVRKVAKLARLEISEEDVSIYTSQLEKILEYVAQLDNINTDNIPPTTRAVEVVNVLREDTVTKEIDREELLNLAPEREGEFYKVPKILSD
ncbi:Asp-tRNA(Asn)/Glu-tRNA(Gln) amidotransferase subunit GatC [Prochlorococcus marinus]|uniref:Asp-tRNA(Asn)/Glu-tRNA(Gln) amidotransferase subunit GatC n=1 Tax=Prochlorococcus marinus TaxID=1219 RepID=UPI0022B2F238|nr:Asp-tRNA(Asn)/Glu-tRNA(Gln) amidotransferase subunit GatC [Prochlorococcus marinus]